MLVKTLLNHIEGYKGFVYEDVKLAAWEGEECILVTVRARKGTRCTCSGCGRRCSVYDHRDERRFRYVPLWGIPVFFLYIMRRANCLECGVKVESVPWATGKSPVSRSLALYLADWAKLLSWKDTAQRFGVNWRQVYDSVRLVVEWGLARRDLSGVTAIGIDEVQYGKGHHYLTVVYQLCGDARRLLYVGQRREKATLNSFLDEMGQEWCEGIQYVCTDMWKAYLTVVGTRLSHALHILDRFHIVKLLNEAVDDVRKAEAAKLRKEGVDLLKGMKYAFLKRPENLTENQQKQLTYALNKRWLATARAYLWKEKFQLFWEYQSPYWARNYLRRWCMGAMHSRLEPIKKFVGTVRRHEELMMNWFEARKMYSSGAVEGMNRKLNLITRRAYGYRNYEVLKVALFHTLGHLPEPERTHRF